jgi:hypothetical protein
VPEIDELGDERHDMRSFYYGYNRLIQGLLAATMLVQTANDALIMDSFAATPSQLGRFAVLAVLVPGLVSARPSVHSVQVVVLTILAVMGSAYFGYRIQ